MFVYVHVFILVFVCLRVVGSGVYRLSTRVRELFFRLGRLVGSEACFRVVEGQVFVEKCLEDVVRVGTSSSSVSSCIVLFIVSVVCIFPALSIGQVDLSLLSLRYGSTLHSTDTFNKQIEYTHALAST